MKRHLIRLPLLLATILTTILFLFGNSASAGKLIFHFNDGVTPDSVYTFAADIDTLWISFPNPSRENYELEGWYEDAAFTQGPYTPGASYYVPNNDNTAGFFNSDHDFYAKWQTPPPTGSYKKLGLIERFTNTGCGPCVSYNKAGYTQWITTHKKDVAVIHYHVSWPSSSNPMYQYNKDLPTYMYWTNYGSILAPGGSGGVPAVATEGKLLKDVTTPSNAAFDSWKAEMDTTTSPVRIVPSISVNSGVVTITNKVMSEMAFTGAKLYTMLIEDSVMYNDPYNEKIFPNVARYAFPNNSPFETLTITAGQSIKRSYTYDIGTLNETHLRVVSYLKTSDGMILNAGQAFVGDPEPQTYTIAASAGVNGTITPKGDIAVLEGDNQAFTFKANSGYRIDKILVDGANNTAAVTSGSYTFTDVQANHTISATFAVSSNSYTINYNLNGGKFNGDYPTSYTAEELPLDLPTPTRDGYTFAGWYENSSFNGDRVDNIKKGTTGNKKFWARWEASTVTISTASNPAEGGTITISPSDVVEIGTEVTLTATANSKWKFVNWATIGDSILSTNSTYTFTVTGDVNFITANFEPDNAVLDNLQRLVKINFDGERMLQLLLPEDMTIRELQLVDVLGFCRYQTTNIQQNVELPLLPSGTYWLLLRHSKGIESHSIVKVK